MGEVSTIEWTDSTWNPITGCSLVSEGCRHCYAATLAATRLSSHPSRAGLARRNAAGEAKFTGEVRFNEQWLDQPLRWRRPRMIFVCAHGDLFHENVPDEWIDRVFAVMSLAPQHTFQVLTKRPERARAYLTDDGGFGRWGFIEHHARHLAKVPAGKTLAIHGGSNLPNVWLGTSVENQSAADERIQHLLATPAAVRFVSAEPLLGPVDVAPWLHDSDCYLFGGVRGRDDVCTCSEPREAPINWVIVGGESGPGARPMRPDWARSLRDQCATAGVAFFFKQWGAWLDEGQATARRRAPGPEMFDAAGRPTGDGWHFYDQADPLGGAMIRIGKKAAGRLLDGVEHNGMPA